MSFFDDTLIDTITIAQQSSVSESGDPAYGTQATVRARVQRGKDRNAEEIEHTHVIYTSTAIRVTDRVWLPEDDASSAEAARVPQAVQQTQGLDGDDTLFKVLI